MKSRVLGLDILRVTAILAVLFAHSSYLLDIKISESTTYTIGFFGVELFFVLSGFLIGTILIRSFKNNEFKFTQLKVFWIRRWFRTIPVYFFALFFHAFILFIVDNYYFVFYNPKWYLYFFFIQNSFSVEPELFGIAWSLSIEEWFYLIVPTIFFLVNKRFKLNSETQLTVIISIIFLFVCFRFIYCSFPIDNFDLEVRKRMPFRIDSIIYGVLAAYLFIKYPKQLEKRKIQLLVLGALIVFFGFYIISKDFKSNLQNLNLTEMVFIFPVISLGISFCIPYFSLMKANKQNYVHHTITFISLISYSIYLFHIPVINLLSNLISNRIILFCSIWIITFILSWITYSFIEKPFLKIRDSKFNEA